jgi:hypothetical protein
MHASAQKMPTINRVVVDVHRKQLNMKARRKNPILVEKKHLALRLSPSIPR